MPAFWCSLNILYRILTVTVTELLTLLASSVYRLCNGTISVRPSVSLSRRSSSDVQVVSCSPGAGDRDRPLAAGAAYEVSAAGA